MATMKPERLERFMSEPEFLPGDGVDTLFDRNVKAVLGDDTPPAVPADNGAVLS